MTIAGIDDLKVIAAGLLLVPSASTAEDIAGAWSGTWTKNGDALTVVVTFGTSRNAILGHSIRIRYRLREYPLPR